MTARRRYRALVASMGSCRRVVERRWPKKVGTSATCRDLHRIYPCCIVKIPGPSMAVTASAVPATSPPLGEADSDSMDDANPDGKVRISPRRQISRLSLPSTTGGDGDAKVREYLESTVRLRFRKKCSPRHKRRTRGIGFPFCRGPQYGEETSSTRSLRKKIRPKSRTGDPAGPWRHALQPSRSPDAWALPVTG